ncbi:cytochrome b [Bradyrhizobium ivorense]|uniref:cytochrome b n=1 Tax=Bradyrhizobium ivorense TaxID=2511166 RepID=UPI0010B628B2|nr:cytochrome b [Bradyrhizobium ivorense]MCC8936354.1 cytochrome b [Bradyrhizobium ivorense]VIO76604.1 Cytochrome b561 [Bradyrhizobium ivorense]
MMRNNSTAWGWLARAFHWGLGAVIIGMIAYGWWMNHFAARPDRFFHRSIHADIGYLVLLFTVLRLIWRAVNPTPALPADTPHWQRIAARVSHGALYAVTILVAVLGWAHSGAHTPDYSSFFGLFHVPQITSPDKAAAQAYEDRHILFAYVLLALIALHLAAVAFHHFVRRDRVAARMIGAPGRRRDVARRSVSRNARPF